MTDVLSGYFLVPFASAVWLEVKLVLIMAFISFARLHNVVLFMKINTAAWIHQSFSAIILSHCKYTLLSLQFNFNNTLQFRGSVIAVEIDNKKKRPIGTPAGERQLAT